MFKFSAFFSSVQETDWYRDFLNPVIAQVEPESRLLDIGTGSGKLLQRLSDQGAVQCTGVDTNAAMLSEASKKLKGSNIPLLKTEPNQPLPFENASFDYITLCNVLFLLTEAQAVALLNEAFRVLKPQGKIMVLTPTGKPGILSQAFQYKMPANASIFIWNFATARAGRVWSEKSVAVEYSKIHGLKYHASEHLGDLALLEILYK